MSPEMKGKIPKGATIDQWVEDLATDMRAIVRELRKIIKKAAPQAKEVIMYSWPAYKVNKPIATMVIAGDHVTLMLYRGPNLKPAEVPLEGTGKTMRHLKIFDAAEIKKLPIAELIKEAVELAAADKK